MWTKKFLLGIVFTLLFLCQNISYSQSGWVWQNPTPFGAVTFNGITFLNSQTGWTGSGPALVKTTNGGINWVRVLYVEGKIFNNIQFLSEQTGYATLSKGKYYKTTNGGTNWAPNSLPDTNFTINNFYFKNETTGFLMGGSSNQILRTSNGGLNWTLQTTPTSDACYITLFNNTDGILFCKAFVSPMTIYRTTNAGLNWTNPNSLAGADMSTAFFTDMNTGWVSGYKAIWKTSNGGVNWVSQYNDDSLTAYSVQFINSQTGYISAANGKVLKTINGGTNWLLQRTSSPLRDFYDISVVDANTVYTCGDGGKIFKTTDGGTIWTSVLKTFSDSYWYDSQVFDASTIYLTGSVPNLSGGYLAKSSNGGVNWVLAATAIISPTRLQFLDQQTGWVSGNGLSKTTNGGQTWQNLLPVNLVYSMHFLNEQTGWVYQNGSILKTTNGGTNWQTGAPMSTIKDIQFLNSSIGYAAGMNDGKIYKSTNAGSTWQSISEGGPSVSRFQFINTLTGWLTSNINIGKTVNGGVNWTYFPTSSPMSDLKFIDSSKGWAVGYEAIYYSSNGGTVWNEQNHSNFNGLGMSTVDFADANVGWAAGWIGSVLKTTNGGLTMISHTSTKLPEKYSLYQNYPNPFNPSTNIKFDIHKQGIASLKVFDLLGKEVATLVDEQLSVGSYEVTFNANILSSGIYFYVLKTGDFVESKRMILVK